MTKYNIQELRRKINAMAATTTPPVKDSEGYYQATTAQNGTASAILRFLAAPPGEEFPFVQLYNHAAKTASGTWYIDNCPVTVTLPCPACESGTKRKMYYISNVLVVLDPVRPENEGKVFLYKYGETIMCKINDVMTLLDPFDALEGANLRLRIIRSGNFPNYEKSTFDGPSAIGDEDLIARVLGQRRSLTALVAPGVFKDYDTLKAKYDLIVGAK
jgi:hypothetical protein